MTQPVGADLTRRETLELLLASGAATGRAGASRGRQVKT